MCRRGTDLAKQVTVPLGNKHRSFFGSRFLHLNPPLIRSELFQFIEHWKMSRGSMVNRATSQERKKAARSIRVILK